MTTTAEMLVALAGSDRPGLLFEDEQFSWAEVVAEGAKRAVLARSRRRPGPFHIGVLLDNEPEYVFWLVGAALSGAAIVGINPTRRGAELAHDIVHTDCQMIVTSTTRRGLLDGLDLNVGPADVLLVDDPDYRALVASQPAVDLDELIAPVRETDRYLLLFTSGSTGAPKAVVCSQQRFATLTELGWGTFGLGPDDIVYNAMPMFHGNALMASWGSSLGLGIPWATRRTFSASGFMPDVRKFRATFFNYVGRALAYILATPTQPDDADNTLRLAFGTEASERDLIEFRRRFGCEFIEGYGSSEGLITINRTPDSPPGALGLPRHHIEVAVLNPDTGEECPRARFHPTGELANLEAIGEIVRIDEGAVRFEGYYNNPEATAERLRDGKYWSGDLGYRDEAGFFYFAGRGSDWLRVDSENFSTGPLERIIGRFPGVIINGVYAVPDSRTGDQVMVAIELDPGVEFDPEVFDAFLAAQPDLGTKWSPRYVRVIDSMPLTGTNKIDKKPLRNARWDAEQVWWRPVKGAALRPMTNEDRQALAAEFAANGRAGALT